MFRALMVFALSLTGLSAFAEAKKGLYLVVTPGQEGFFSCSLAPESNPPQVNNDLVRFRVTVKGGAAPYLWKVPLYKGRNRSNDVALSRVGEVTPDEKGNFFVDLNITDLEKLGDKKDLVLQIRSQERYETNCRTAAEPIRQVASAVPVKALSVIEGSVTR